MPHVNSGSCEKCLEIINKYPDFHSDLLSWFLKLQKSVPDAHVSCAGRGKEEQEKDFEAGTSKAHYGQSSHNYNCAIDIFRLTQSNGASWDPVWFRDKVGTAVFSYNCSPDKKINLNWYGKPGAKFRELPHIEVDDWSSLASEGLIKLVE